MFSTDTRIAQASRVLTHLKFVPHYLLPQKKESAGTRIQTDEPDEILGYNKNFRQFVRSLVMTACLVLKR